MKLAQGVLVAGRYRLESRLAMGGMGSLWVARHAQLDVLVAIKFMDPHHAASPISRQRFEREAKAAAGLRGTHVVHVQDYGVEDDQPYIVMELLVGEDFARRLKRERRLSLSATAVILEQIARGLRRAHEGGLVHRDLKPPNIFLARGDEGEVVKVLDFGIAKDTNQAVGESTKTGELMGSPHFMSPEQIRCVKDLDARSDLWSLGVLLYRAVVGELPFGGEVIGAVIGKILADPIPRATDHLPSLPAEIDGFFFRAFARDRAERFQSAREMADAFTAIARVYDGAPPPGPPSISVANGLDSARAMLAARPSFPSIGAMEPYTGAPYAGQTYAPPEAPPPLIARDLEPLTRPMTRLVEPSFASEAAPPSPPASSHPAEMALSATPPSGAISSTGGPVIHSAPPPPPPRSLAAIWGITGAAVLGIGIGIVTFALSARRPPPATAAALPRDAVVLAPTAIAPTAIAPTAIAQPEPPPAPVAAEPSAPAASARVEAAKAPAPAGSSAYAAVKSPPAAPPSSAAPKKKPAWGF